MIFTLPFDTPSKKNSRVTDTRTGRSFPNKKFTEWHKKAVAYLRLNFIKDMKPFDGPVQVDMTFTHGTLKRCDSDNKVSSILDLIVDVGFIPDDNWQIVRRIGVTNRYEKGFSSCTVEVRPYE